MCELATVKATNLATKEYLLQPPHQSHRTIIYPCAIKNILLAYLLQIWGTLNQRM